MDTIRAHVIVSGRVQGVFFRSNAKKQAVIRGLTGFVRNMPDRRVEVVFEGEKEVVESMVDWCKRGPEFAFVEHMDVEWLKATKEFTAFDIRY
ncbi:MAG: acylphosphatase [Candidatus Altiarchaeota archaeon]|nr:acylphosphatase [Candidatus Altiarchaeota archaeon]